MERREEFLQWIAKRGERFKVSLARKNKEFPEDDKVAKVLKIMKGGSLGCQTETVIRLLTTLDSELADLYYRWDYLRDITSEVAADGIGCCVKYGSTVYLLTDIDRHDGTSRWQCVYKSTQWETLLFSLADTFEIITDVRDMKFIKREPRVMTLYSWWKDMQEVTI